MKAAIGNRCKDFPEPKTPFVVKPFSGKYAQQGKAEGTATRSTRTTTKKTYTEGKKKANDNGGDERRRQRQPRSRLPRAARPTQAPPRPAAQHPASDPDRPAGRSRWRHWPRSLR